MNDLRFALRQFAKAPGFTAVAVLTLALGIGVNTAMFSVVYGVLVAPYPYAKASQIWGLQTVETKTGRVGDGYSRFSEYLEMAKLPGVAEAMATSPESATLAGELNPEIIPAIRVTGTGFGILGVPPLVGRGLTPADIRPNGEPEPVAVLSFKLWHRLFNGDPAALGRTLTLNGTPYTIVGVMPPRFVWYGDGVWLPLGTTDPRVGVRPTLRLKPGISSEVAGQQLNTLWQAFARAEPNRFPKDGFTASFISILERTLASGEMRSSLHLLFYAVGFLLLIACTNVANLQLARGAARSREIAIRLALGASRARLVRQLLTESVVLALAGGLLGVFFAWGLTHVIVALLPSFYVPASVRVTLNGWVLLFSVGVSILTGVLFGLMPALQCTKPDLNEALKDGGHAGGIGSGARTARTRNTLVVVEVALSIVLLVGASLAIRGFLDLQLDRLGFNAERTLILQIPLDPKRYPTLEQRNRFSRELRNRMQALPGVASATIGILPAFENGSRGMIPGQPNIENGPFSLNGIDVDYLATLGLPLRAGRNLTAAEVEHGDRVALISEATAKLWPVGEDPIGRTIQLDALAAGNANNLVPDGAVKDVTVVGIVGDTRTRNLREKPSPGIFVPYTLRGSTARPFMVKAHGDPKSLLNLIRAEMHALDKEQPFPLPRTLDDVLDRQVAPPRFNMVLFGGLAAVALALAAAGIYSVLSYSVAQRTREIGLRMALGAARGDILRLVLTAGGRLLVVGLVIGIAASIALAKILKSQVFTVPLLDPFALAAASLVLGVVALLACYIPARRATKVDPLVALRCE